jgi:glycosyltransferase involved in cell wall biosynthesis
VDKYRVMYLGLELDDLARQPGRAEARQALGLPQAVPIVGFVGRLHEVKNVPVIVRAMAEPALHHARLAIVGDGPERQAVEALVRDLGLADRVFFTGYRTDLPTVYAALDALVLASSTEGIATVQMEAVAAGVPLVSTPLGLAAEVFTPGQEYIRVERPEAALLAAGVAAALEPERASRLRAAGHETIQRFSIEAQAAYLEALYTELAARHGIQVAGHTAR